MSALLQARGLTVRVGACTACRGLDLDLRPGERWAVLGRNGAGKTTLLLTLAGLHPAAAGEVRLADRPLAALPRREIARRLGLLPQDDADPFPATVLETVLLGRHPHMDPWRGETGADLDAARAALARVGLAGLEGRNVRTLSGGERRRVALATLLAQDPAVALMDEPTGHLDLHQQVALLAETVCWAREGAGRALVMVLHDPALAWRACTHALLLHGDGAWTAGPVGEVLETACLARLYGHPLHRADGPDGPVWWPRWPIDRV
ncbi:ABC transporter ATP-binding protein [Inmirania thermothiophila]|uniref:Iron complex transport system ATP-binding protein n=1 Tax=Inmirania thermothiophila TaxID=1750597 RepID=A0A3N1Y925_9GAMM|nr:ABC transporter ATP-binding protein [Inmirania thermothiophila]ROR34998.1 iron complex transport system ATP-binding protein [Inmirania thermothiophila]